MTSQVPKRNIVGGGFAGTKLAQRIEHRLPPGWQTTLISQENFITYNPLLPEVVGASMLPGRRGPAVRIGSAWSGGLKCLSASKDGDGSDVAA